MAAPFPCGEMLSGFFVESFVGKSEGFARVHIPPGGLFIPWKFQWNFHGTFCWKTGWLRASHSRHPPETFAFRASALHAHVPESGQCLNIRADKSSRLLSRGPDFFQQKSP